MRIRWSYLFASPPHVLGLMEVSPRCSAARGKQGRGKAGAMLHFHTLFILNLLPQVVGRPGYCNGQHANAYVFAALTSSGTIQAWGYQEAWGYSGAPTSGGFVSIASTWNAFAALTSSGTIKGWGDSDYGGSGAPTSGGFVSIASTQVAFAALTSSGTIKAWGGSGAGGSGAPTGGGFASIASTRTAWSPTTK